MCFGLSQDEGSQNEVCRKSWDLFRELEQERRDESSSKKSAGSSGSSSENSKGTKRVAAAECEVASKKKKRSTGDEEEAEIIAEIELDDEDIGGVEVYDTCDSLREKISEYLEQKEVTQAAFCRALSKSMINGKKVTPAQLKAFMAKDGAKAGNMSAAFYAGYCFMEKIRLFKKEPKSEFRLDMEDIWDGTQPITDGRLGFDIWNSDNTAYVVPAWVSGIEYDDYGIMHTIH